MKRTVILTNTPEQAALVADALSRRYPERAFSAEGLSDAGGGVVSWDCGATRPDFALVMAMINFARGYYAALSDHAVGVAAAGL